MESIIYKSCLGMYKNQPSLMQYVKIGPFMGKCLQIFMMKYYLNNLCV